MGDTKIEIQKKEEFDEEDFDFEGVRENTTFLIHMIAGSIAGLMEHVAMFPVDTIKVKANLTKIGSYANID